MVTATSVLESEWFLPFPGAIREAMNIQVGDYFFAYSDTNGTLLLSRAHPGKSKYCNGVEFHDGRGTVLPHGFLRRMQIRPGDELELTVKGNKIEIQKSGITPLFSSAILEKKLKREFEAISRCCRQSFREDIYSVLTLTKWSNEEVRRLSMTPNLLHKVEAALRDDDMYSDFFELRTKILALNLTIRQDSR